MCYYSCLEEKSNALKNRLGSVTCLATAILEVSFSYRTSEAGPKEALQLPYRPLETLAFGMFSWLLTSTPCERPQVGVDNPS